MFITFEGPDGSGKTTQIERLTQTLEASGCHVVCTREPGGTQVAEKIRDILLFEMEETIHKETEMLLYASARAQHVRELIIPSLEAGYVVLCDRYIDSSLVYQGMARGLSLETVLAVNELAIGGVWPDLTFVLDLPVDESLSRLQKMNKELDRLEQEKKEFKEKTRQGYLQLKKMYPERIVLLDAMEKPNILQKVIWETTQEAMK
ncbi:dTMP kinase [Clostridia bacterium]|nr:dTMP kinase [Clostridia bacterium]